MKKLVSSLLIVCIYSALFSVTGFGESGGLSDEVYSTLVGYEIITADEAENSGQVLTRREAAKTLTLLLGMENVPDLTTENSPFLDVPADDEYAPYIIMGSELGILSGDGNGFFRPGDTLSREEAAKILVSCLGYDSAAEEAGGYPSVRERYKATVQPIGVCRAFAPEGPPHGYWDWDALAVDGYIVFAEEYHAVVVFLFFVVYFCSNYESLSLLCHVLAYWQPELPRGFCPGPG